MNASNQDQSSSSPEPIDEDKLPFKVNPWISLATRRPVAVLMISIAIAVFGLISLTRLPLDLMPEMSYPSVTVRANYPGAAPEDVEDRVAKALERSLSLVRNLKRISSISRAESVDLILEFSWDTDMKAVLQDMREKLDQSFLPDGVERPTLLRYDPRLDPILQIGVSGRANLLQLRKLSEEEIERRLEVIPGVAAVKVRGGHEEEIRVELDEAALRSRSLSVDLVSRRISEENIDQASGLLKEGEVTYLVRTRNELNTLDEIRQIPIQKRGDSIIRLGEIATISRTHKEERILTRIGGEPAVKIEIYREAQENMVDLSRSILEQLFGSKKDQADLKKWRASLLEEGIELSSKSAAELEQLAQELTVEEEKDSDSGNNRQQSERKNSDEEALKKSRLAQPPQIAAKLPADIKLTVLSNQANFVEGSISDLKQTAILGGLLAIAVLFAFLGRITYTAIVAISIPFSIAATFAPMYMGGTSLNIMSLGGLALGIGMLVDSSIVVLEAIFRHLERGASPREAAALGASEVAGAVTASTLTTIAVFFPIVFVEGIAGQIFKDQALTVVYSLLASLVASLTLIPMLAARLGSVSGFKPKVASFTPKLKLESFSSFILFAKKAKHIQYLLILVRFPWVYFSSMLELISYCFQWLFVAIGFVLAFVIGLLAMLGSIVCKPLLWAFHNSFNLLESAYVKVLAGALKARMLVALCAVLSLGGAYLLSQRLGSELIPAVSQGEIQALIRYQVGTPIKVTSQRVKEFERSIRALDDVASVVCTIGLDPEEVSHSGEGEHTARFRIRVQQGVEQLAAIEERLLNKLEVLFTSYSEFEVELSRPQLFSFRTPLEVEISGHDLSQLKRLSQEVQTLMRKQGNLRSIRSNLTRGNPEVHLFPDRDKMARFDITSSDLAKVLQEKNVGLVSTQFRAGDQKVDLRVRVKEDDRNSIESIMGLTVRSRGENGSPLKIADLTLDVEEREGPSEIRRIGRKRVAVVSAEPVGVDLATASSSIEKAIFEQLKLPLNVDVSVVGQRKEMERSSRSMLGALLLAIFLVYVVMASQFESLLQPFIILFTIPLAAAGVMFTLFISGHSFSVISFIGMIVLAGIVVNNAIVLVDLVNRLRSDGYSVQDAIVEAGKRRLRPILMTTITTVLGMIPLTGILANIPHESYMDWLLGSGAGSELRAPLAYTVIGGLLSSTLLTLIVIPVVYSVFVRERKVNSSRSGDGSSPEHSTARGEGQ